MESKQPKNPDYNPQEHSQEQEELSEADTTRSLKLKTIDELYSKYYQKKSYRKLPIRFIYFLFHDFSLIHLSHLIKFLIHNSLHLRYKNFLHVLRIKLLQSLLKGIIDLPVLQSIVLSAANQLT